MPYDQSDPIDNSNYKSWILGREEPLAVTTPRAKQQRPHYVSIPST